MTEETEKRITYKRTRPNPVFQGWLEDLCAEAKAKKSKLEPMLKEALDSMYKYPLPLSSGAECAVLKGFDKNLCIHFDQRIEIYNHNLAIDEYLKALDLKPSRSDSDSDTSLNEINGNFNSNKVLPPAYSPVTKNSKNKNRNEDKVLQESATYNTETNCNSEILGTKEKSKAKQYKPAFRSGAYALLLALYEFNLQSPDEGLSKEDLIDKAQKYAEESFVRPKPDTFYTAWSSMSTLVKRELVRKVRAKSKLKISYALSEEGIKLAKELYDQNENRVTVNDVIFNDAPTSSVGNSSKVKITTEPDSLPLTLNKREIKLLASSFEVVLLIDKNETSGLSKKNDPTVAQFNKFPDLNHEYRSLKVGDFVWIARHKENKDQELVLPFVVERKRMDDLGASIKDGRFHEQKFRLRKCGLNNVIYLVENYGSNTHVGLPLQSLRQALANTRIQDGFKVHVTDSLTGSVRFLAMMTKRLTIRFKDKDLIGCSEVPKNNYLMTFNYFNKASAKTKALTVTDTFTKLLLQIKGVSIEKALAITAKYPTPKSLFMAYDSCGQGEKELLLANLKFGDLNRNVGPAVSKSVHLLFSCV